MAEQLEMKSGGAKEVRGSPRARQERSISLRDVNRDPELARRLEVAMDAVPARERRRSLRGVGGEIREEPDATDQKPDLCNEKADPNAVRRTPATTSLLRSPQRSPGKTCLLANSTVLLVAAISVALLIGVLAWNKSRSRYGRYHLPPDPRGPLRVRRCRSEACRRIGALLNNALDDNVQPCDDFHAYVCGSWSHKYPGKTIAEVLASAFLGYVTRRARKNVVIPSKHAASNQTAVQKAATHLLACDNIVALSDDQTADVKRVLAEGGIALGSFTENGSTPDVLKAMFYMSQVVKIPVLLDVSVEYGVEQRVSIQSPENTETLLEESKRHLNDATSEKYDGYVRAIYESFSGSENTSEFEQLFMNVSHLESTLVTFLSSSLADSEEDEDSVWYYTTASIHQISRAISKDRWLKAFEAFLSIPQERNMPVVVHAGAYFQALFNLQEKLGEADFAQLYSWLCIQALVPFTSGRIVSAQHAASRSTVLQRHRWQCFRNAERVFHYALQYPYMAYVADDNVGKDIVALMRTISRSFSKVVLRTTSQNTNCTFNSDEVLAGVHAELFSRTVPDYFEGYYADFPDMTSIALTNWMRTAEFGGYITAMSGDTPSSFGDIVDVNYARAWSRPLEASYLDAPWYSLGVPLAVKFAGLGSRLVSRLITELVSKRRACNKALLAEVEGTLDCLAAAYESPIRNFSAIERDVRAAVISWDVLWTALGTRVDSKANDTVLEDFPRLSQPALFYVLGCLLTCGEDRETAEFP
ncbi:endothelin-converting enzyme 1 [Rhipicephalus sanguineus]|uniref:endothelin-converting enzyme 1 n=1 Tax=Rhipicephalus sanguineus TaxID=34632 RepID=UPI0018950EC9|nr:endothelin-converting enzyme 1 [Rhipicephalus sanguineus]